MHTSVPVRKSERLQIVQSNQTMMLQDSSIIKQENMLGLRKSPRLRELTLKEMKCPLSTEPTEIVCAISSVKQEKEVLVFCRKRRKQRSSKKMGRTDIVKQNDSAWNGQVNNPIWSGSISVSHENFGLADGLAAYMSSKANAEVVNAVQLLPAVLHAQVLSRLDVWPAGFHGSPPTDDIIDLYILPAEERSEDVFYRFLDAIPRKDVVLKAVYADISILIFSSLQLTNQHRRTTSGKYYLGAVFEGKNSFFPHCLKNKSFELNFGCDNPSLYLTDELQPATENEEDRERIHGVNHDNTLLLEIESPSAIRNFSTPDVQVVSESIGASVLEMANKFDSQSCEEEISSASAYYVDPKHARILRAILDKHGDITRECPIKSTKMVTCALERICVSVEQFENMRFVNLLPSHLQSMLSAITDAEMIKLDVKWLRDRYEEFVEAIEHLKAYRNLKDRRKEVNKRVAIKKNVRSWKKDEMLKLKDEVEKLDTEIAEGSQEKETVSCGIRDATSKCKFWCQNSLIDGLV